MSDSKLNAFPEYNTDPNHVTGNMDNSYNETDYLSRMEQPLTPYEFTADAIDEVSEQHRRSRIENGRKRRPYEKGSATSGTNPSGIIEG